MLVFVTSDKGGTGRSVTGSNLVYRRALQGSNVAYLDFDFGSPTAGSIFQIPSVERGSPDGGLHAYLRGTIALEQGIDVWNASDLNSLRGRPDGAGRLVLFPGEMGGGEFHIDKANVERCIQLLLRLEEEFDIVLVDLSAGRSFATQIALEATADGRLAATLARWLVFHRWTKQHIIAASGLIFGPDGILEIGQILGHDPSRLKNSIRTVRTAVVDPDADNTGLTALQIQWLRGFNRELQILARDRRIGEGLTLGSVPLDPLLQWREQLISDVDTIGTRIANQATVDAFELIAKNLTDDTAWTGL